MALNFPVPSTQGETYNASNNIAYVWDGEKWTSLGSITMTQNVASVGTAAPTSPSVGSLWYDTTNSILKIYQSGQWTDVRPSS